MTTVVAKVDRNELGLNKVQPGESRESWFKQNSGGEQALFLFEVNGKILRKGAIMY